MAPVLEALIRICENNLFRSIIRHKRGGSGLQRLPVEDKEEMLIFNTDIYISTKHR